MLATHRVKDSDSKTICFMLEDGAFYIDYYLSGFFNKIFRKISSILSNR